MAKKRKLSQQDLLRFVVIVAIVTVALSYYAYLDQDVPFIQRGIAAQTAGVAQLVGVEAQTFEEWVEVPIASLTEEQEKSIEISLAKLTLTVEKDNVKLTGMNNFLTEAEKETLQDYLDYLRGQGVVAEYQPAVIVTPELTLKIVPACTAMLALAAITALVLAYPKATKKGRLYGVVLGWGLVYAANIFRLGTGVVLGNWFGPGVFEALHVLLWREAMLAFTLVLWWFWLKKLAHTS